MADETKIPADAREVYYDEKGEPLSYCPKESIGLTDFQRIDLYTVNKKRLEELRQRAIQKGPDHVVICINVDDRTWAPLVEMLMPGQDWTPQRSRGETPLAQGVVGRQLVIDIAETFYPAALPAPEGQFIAILSEGGVSLF